MSMRCIFACVLPLLVFALLIIGTAAKCRDKPVCRRYKYYYGPEYMEYMCSNRARGRPPIIPNIREICKKSCGLCLPAEPGCSRTRYGCCWDKITSKLYEDGRNCPECKDKHPHLCRRFAELCKNEIGKSFQFMHIICPVTCGDCASDILFKYPQQY